MSNQTLLDQQQQTTDKINALLDQANQLLSCGPTCQKLKRAEELKQKYLDAETNMQTAPQQLEESRRKYYTFVAGETGYNELMEKELKDEADQLAERVTVEYNKEVQNAKTMNSYFNTALINSGYTEELYDAYVRENAILTDELKNTRGDILTNDRKTYYEQTATSSLKNWYRFFWYIYYIMVVMLVIAFLGAPSQLTKIQKVVIFIAVLFYPMYIHHIFSWIYNSIMKVYHWLPKSIYNSL
jgi:hypothetical protein